jgi:hypothetical protein
MKRSSLFLCLIGVCSLILSACGHRSGHEFLGKWASVDRPSETIVISQNGKFFIIAGPNNELVATYFEDTLAPNNGKGWCSYLKDSDSMNCAGTSYKRAK